MGNGDSIAKMFEDLTHTAVLHILLIVAAALLLIAVSQRALSWLADKLSGRPRLYLLASIPLLRLLVIAAAVALIVLQIVEPTVANVVALIGAMGLFLGFGLKDYVSSLIAGLVALYEMPYRPGDWIEVEGVYGEVKRIGMRAVEIVTPDDTTVTVPHMKLWGQLFHNANDGGPTLLCVAEFYLAPHHDPAAARQVLHDVALTSPFWNADTPVWVLVSETPWGTRYRLKAYPIDLRQQFRFATDLTVRGKTALARLGMDFATAPASSAWDGSPRAGR